MSTSPLSSASAAPPSLRADPAAGSPPGPAAPHRARAAGRTGAAGPASAARAPAAGPARARALQTARPTAAPKPAPRPSKPPSGYAPASSSGEWAFLDDARMSIEDKLFLFMKKVLEKTDKDLADKMKEYKAKFVQAKAPSAPKKGMSLFDVAKQVVPGLGLAADLIGEAGVKKLAASMGGPVLAAAATAAGLPVLAPLALKYGGDIAGLAFKDVGGSASSASAAPAEAGGPDEKLAMLELQVLVEKQQRMFAAVSGALKAMHDAQMVAVQNIR